MAIETREAVKGFSATAAIEQYRLLRLTAGSGTAVEHCGAEDEPIGISDQDDVAVGEFVSVRLLSDAGTAKVQAAGAIAIGDRVYPAANGQIDDVTTANGKSIGVALEAATAANDIIEVLLDGATGNRGDGLIHANLADSAAVTNTVAQTAFDQSKTIRGSLLQIGDVIHAMARGHFPSTNAADTATIRMRLGTEVIAATAATDVANDDIFLIEAWIVVRATGAAGTLSASGIHAIGADGTATCRPFRLNAAAENIAGDVELDVTCQWSAAAAANQAVLEDIVVELLRQ